MRLCKYVTADRVDILRDGRIRFTQPNIFNDPFEMSPVVSGLGTTVGLHPEIVERARIMYDALPEEDRKRASFDDLLAEIQAQLGLAPPEIRDGFREVYDAWPKKIRKRLSYNEALTKASAWIRENDSGLVKMLQHVLLPTFFADTGILSLAERPDNLLMWSHYADQHRGLIIEFDGDHPFFDQRQGEDDQFHYLCKVSYSADRAATTFLSFFGPLTFFTKSQEWEYEQEWRMLVSFERFPHQKLKQGRDDIRLVSFPPVCISRVILGHRMPDDKKSEILDLVTKDRRYRHVEVLQAELDPLKFSLNFRSLAEHYFILGKESLERAQLVLGASTSRKRNRSELLQLSISDFGKAIRLAPNESNYTVCRGLAHQLLGKHKEAIEDYSQAILLDPENGILHSSRGAIHFLLGTIHSNREEIKQAERDFEMALALGENDVQPHLDAIREFLATPEKPAKKTAKKSASPGSKKKRARK